MVNETPEFHEPPRRAQRFLRWFCAESFLEELEGDLSELFQEDVSTYGLHKANRRYVFNVVRYITPFFFAKRTFSLHLYYHRAMLKHNIKVSVRSLRKQLLFSLIHVVGLAIGLAACFLILQYVRFERSYDQFHQNGKNLYRVTINQSAANHPGAGPALKAEFPEVEEFARMLPQSIFIGNNGAWSYLDESGHEKVFNEEGLYNVDASFLRMFSFPFIYGDPNTALSDVSSVVISERISNKFFGSENPVGKTLVLNGERSFTVTGVLQNVPENSHLEFEILVSYFHREGWGSGWGEEWNWAWPEYYTYVQLAPHTNLEALKSKFPDFISTYLGGAMKALDQEFKLGLQPIRDIHLRSPNLTKERVVHGNEQTVYFLTLVALFILLIAWINYINLSTSRSIDRVHEVGLRKVVGATKGQLITRYLLESAIINALAILLALGLIAVTLPYFNQISGKNINAGILDLLRPDNYQLWLWVAGVFILGSLLPGLYPAVLLSSFSMASTLKGKFLRSRSGIVLRKILVGTQFIVSVALISGTYMVHKQVTFMRAQELGYVKDRLVVVKSPTIVDSSFVHGKETFKTELKRSPHIHQVASSSDAPGSLISSLNGAMKLGETMEAYATIFYYFVDHDFVETYDLEVLGGRNFAGDDNLLPLDGPIPVPILANEAAIEELGFSSAIDAVDQLINFGLGTKNDWKGQIIGVVRNHHQRSLREGYDPILFFPTPQLLGNYFTINLNVQHSAELFPLIEGAYQQAFPGNQFEYFFLDDHFDRQYAADQHFGKVFSLFSALALSVACLGLFGLITFLISRRTKEIAIRKVLGAKISSMVLLFSQGFVKLIIMANLVALPITYVLGKNWLNNFAFQVSMDGLMFVIPAAILLIISLSTIGYQSVRTGSGDLTRYLRQQ